VTGLPACSIRYRDRLRLDQASARSAGPAPMRRTNERLSANPDRCITPVRTAATPRNSGSHPRVTRNGEKITSAASAASAAATACRMRRRPARMRSTGLCSCLDKNRRCLTVYAMSVPQAASQNMTGPHTQLAGTHHPEAYASPSSAPARHARALDILNT